MILYHAAPHKWGPGRVHFLDLKSRKDLQLEKTMCGRVIGPIPGKLDFGQVADVDCQSCLKLMGLRVAETVAQLKGETEK